MSPEEFDLVMKVNAYGPVRMIKAFEPLLIAQKGRIINIGSISGILASQNLPAYSMSKHAIEALTDSLAVQLAESGVQVSVVEPGNYNSNIGKSALARMGADSKAAVATGYKVKGGSVHIQGTRRSCGGGQAGVIRSHRAASLHGSSESGRGGDNDQAEIEQLVQLNERQPHSYDRAALVKMLDDALARVPPKGK
jgi:hypothetical protein